MDDASGTYHDGDYALFSTAVYEHINSNAPKFEELAACRRAFFTFITMHQNWSSPTQWATMANFLKTYF